LEDTIDHPLNKGQPLKRLYVPALFLSLSCLIFLPHVLQFGVFVGDSDRMNHSLSILKTYIDIFESGQFPLWSDTIFGGYSLVSIPFQFPNPVALLGALAGIKDVYQFAGYEAIILLALSGWFAYKFLIATGRTKYSAIIGGILYQTCNLTLLKVAQNDMSFIVITLTPILLLKLKQINKNVSLSNYIVLALIFAILYNFSFIQKVGYITLLASGYVVWLSVKNNSARIIWASLLAATPGILISIPRLITIGQDFNDSNRAKANVLLNVNQSLSPIELLRWFDARIFGSSWNEMTMLGNGVNLSEGFLLYMGFFSAFVILYCLFKRLPWKINDDDGKFSVYVLIISIFIVFTPLGYQFIYYLFWKIGFIHYRFLIVCILPSVILITLVLDYWGTKSPDKFPIVNKQSESNVSLLLSVNSLALAVGALSMIAIEIISFAGKNKWLPPIKLIPNFITLDGGAFFRVSILILFWCAIFYAISKRYMRYTTLRYIVGAALVSQSIIYSSLFIWGPDRWNVDLNFRKPSIIMAPVEQIKSPSKELIEDIDQKLLPKLYRTSFICNPKEVGINCSTRISHNFHLRTIDGYLNSVPSRIANLKLMPNDNTRAITHSNIIDLNWAMLGLLNTKFILYYQPGLLTNLVKRSNGKFEEININDLKIVENPFHVVPRIFFTNSIISVNGPNEALDFLHSEHAMALDGYHPEILSVIEGDLPDQKYSIEGEISAEYFNSIVKIKFPESAKSRFLVLNERYNNDWHAFDASGKEIKVYPVNAFMRGVVIEPGNNSILFKYRPYLIRSEALFYYFGGILIFAISCLGILRRKF
jgi:hypothetical protein